MSIFRDLRGSLKLALPICLSQVSFILVGFIDTIMVGQLGKIPLAASAFANNIFWMIIIFFTGLFTAVQTLTSKALGEDKHDQKPVILQTALMIAIISSLLMIVIFRIGENLLLHMGQPHDVAAATIPFFKWITYSILPLNLLFVFRMFADAQWHNRWPLFILLSTTLLNIPLNYIFIYGMGLIPAYGLEGAGIATFIVRITAAVLLGIYIFTHHKFNTNNIFKKWLTNITVAKEILKIGTPSGAQYLIEVSAFALASVMIGWIDAASLASHQIAINIASLSFMIIVGLGSAGNIRVAFYVGERNFLRAKEICLQILALSTFIQLFFMAAFMLFSKSITAFYTTDLEILSIAPMLIILAGGFQLFDGWQAAASGLLRGYQDTFIPSLVTLLSYWIIGLPTCYLLGIYFNYGAHGIWVGLSIGLGFMALLLLWRLWSQIKLSLSSPS